jgi:hypothetical protein
MTSIYVDLDSADSRKPDAQAKPPVKKTGENILGEKKNSVNPYFASVCRNFKGHPRPSVPFLARHTVRGISANLANQRGSIRKFSEKSGRQPTFTVQ